MPKPMSNVLSKAALITALATSALPITAHPRSFEGMQPVDWYTNAVTADEARNRADADRDYYNRQYYNRQYENQRYNQQLYNQQYYDRQYENQRYNQQRYNQQRYNQQYYNRQYYNSHR